MRISRLFLPGPLQSGQSLHLSREESHYLNRVLRLKNQAPLRVFDGRGGEFNARIDATDRRTTTLILEDHLPQERESPLSVTLALGISRGDRMDFALQKAVELGVTRISPLLTKRSLVQLKSHRADQKLSHWRKVVISACEQCGRNRLPDLQPASDINAWISKNRAELKLVFSPYATGNLSGIPSPDGGLTILLGPEGGFSDTEIQLSIDAGFLPVSFGPRILRTETAVIAALTAVQLKWGDL